ncbi:MAG: hypothetical protein GEV06_10955 [Luteitalea sp.]|nr:hypothetical protein [Luteitalea sp.]
MITASSGEWSHKANVTITGARFGSKPNPAPIVWDDASGTNLRDKWDGGWPDRAKNSDFNIGYRRPIRGVSPPHNRVGRYLAGAHGESTANAGYNVMVWKAYENTGSMYLSYWYQMDPAWTFGGDNNHKLAIHSVGTPPYVPDHFNYEYNVRPTSPSSDVKWHVYTNSPESFLGPNPRLKDNHTWFGAEGTNPVGRWAKHEIIAKWSAGSDGMLVIYDNGKKVLEYQGRTDGAPGTKRVEAIGGFGRPYGKPNNWRYFADLYFDTTLARVMLGNASSLERSTKREVQIATQWADSSITLSVNLGVFNQGETAYLYVVDSDGNVNEEGYPIKVGGSGGGDPGPGPDPTTPKAPVGLRVVGP